MLMPSLARSCHQVKLGQGEPEVGLHALLDARFDPVRAGKEPEPEAKVEVILSR
jgi:hypothetical protein